MKKLCVLVGMTVSLFVAAAHASDDDLVTSLGDGTTFTLKKVLKIPFNDQHYETLEIGGDKIKGCQVLTPFWADEEVISPDPERPYKWTKTSAFTFQPNDTWYAIYFDSLRDIAAIECWARDGSSLTIGALKAMVGDTFEIDAVKNQQKANP
jgi:hypothetical protein